MGGAIKDVASVLPFYHGVSLAKLPFLGTTDRIGEHLIWTVVSGAVIYVLAISVFRMKMKKDVK